MHVIFCGCRLTVLALCHNSRSRQMSIALESGPMQPCVYELSRCRGKSAVWAAVTLWLTWLNSRVTDWIPLWPAWIVGRVFGRVLWKRYVLTGGYIQALHSFLWLFPSQIIIRMWRASISKFVSGHYCTLVVVSVYCFAIDLMMSCLASDAAWTFSWKMPLVWLGLWCYWDVKRFSQWVVPLVSQEAAKAEELTLVPSSSCPQTGSIHTLLKGIFIFGCVVCFCSENISTIRMKSTWWRSWHWRVLRSTMPLCRRNRKCTVWIRCFQRFTLASFIISRFFNMQYFSDLLIAS